MENSEEVLHSLEEFSKTKPKAIPRELEEYLCFVAKTGNPVYQWPTVKILFREKLLSVIGDFHKSCPAVSIPPCPNAQLFNYDMMKNFILEKLDTFASAPFTVQRICELLTTPRKEYNRIDKYMRALEKNILVVSTTEPGRRSTENGESIMNGVEAEHIPESGNSSHDINIEDMDESPSWPRVATTDAPVLFENNESEIVSNEAEQATEEPTSFEPENEAKPDVPTSSTLEEPEVQHQETVITCTSSEETAPPFVSIEAVPIESCVTSHQDVSDEASSDVSVTITAIPPNVQQRRNSVEKMDNIENAPTASEEDVKSSFVIGETKLVETTQLQVIQEEIVVSESTTESTEVPKDDEQLTSEADVAVPECEESTSSGIEPSSAEVVEAKVSSALEKPRIDELTEEVEKLGKEVENDENEAKQAEVIDTCITTDAQVKEVLTSPVVEPASSSMSADETQVENIADSSTDCKDEVFGKCEEAVENLGEMKVEEVEEKSTITEVPESNEIPEETPMELDVSEDFTKKPEESEEPSSSEDVSL
ncbi:protein phosphatase 4 regulatory subunit 2-related protein [Leptinotarsa decemlineata]|uniref:protein phosphatase 4 regulatory subunit 2-related protein n=1 Tax=Leptinotarsa decemlineata TaxID=7539 RepID=UPI000C25363C|nr:serine/threonine-protein phosphatase 4 regulatory subunit 2 [Leptinotarsa decemlineata]